MIVNEVTKILSFDQTNWLASYIAFNTEKQQDSKNAFKKDFFKLMNNSVYGKTMENVGKYQDLENTLVEAYMRKATVTLNKSIIVRALVLDHNIYKDMAKRSDLFDLNDSKTIGLFKDETLGNIITETYHIWAKSYHYVLANKFTKSKYKR
ncbi:9370_t:CDS:2, partial [Cetraspora pellucida]